MNLFYIGEFRVAKVLGAPLQEPPQVALTDAACSRRIFELKTGWRAAGHWLLLHPRVPLTACVI